jgi:hypothetical protein
MPCAIFGGSVAAAPPVAAGRGLSGAGQAVEAPQAVWSPRNCVRWACAARQVVPAVAGHGPVGRHGERPVGRGIQATSCGSPAPNKGVQPTARSLRFAAASGSA